AGGRRSLTELPCVRANDGRQHRIGYRRGKTIILKDLRESLVRGGDRHLRTQFLGKNPGHLQLVLAVGVGIDETDGDRRDLALAQDTCYLACFTLVERLDDLAAIVDALGHGKAITTADIGWGGLFVGVPRVLASATSDLQHIPKTLRSNHRRSRKTASDQSIRGDRCSMSEQPDIAP